MSILGIARCSPSRDRGTVPGKGTAPRSHGHGLVPHPTGPNGPGIAPGGAGRGRSRVLVHGLGGIGRAGCTRRTGRLLAPCWGSGCIWPSTTYVYGPIVAVQRPVHHGGGAGSSRGAGTTRRHLRKPAPDTPRSIGGGGPGGVPRGVSGEDRDQSNGDRRLSGTIRRYPVRCVLTDRCVGVLALGLKEPGAPRVRSISGRGVALHSSDGWANRTGPARPSCPRCWNVGTFQQSPPRGGGRDSLILANPGQYM